MTKPVRRVRAGQPPDTDEWGQRTPSAVRTATHPDLLIQMIEPKPSKRLGFFVFAAVCALALLGAICIVAYRPSLITGALS